MKTAAGLLEGPEVHAGHEHWVDVIGLQFRSFLKQARDTLRAAAAKRSAADEVRVVQELEPRLGPPFHRFIRLLNQIPAQVPAARLPAVRRRLKELLVDLLMPAPFYRQSFVKPLGYAGDYMTMNIAYTDHYQGETAYAKYLNRMFCDLSVSRAAISRLDYLRQWIGYTVHDSRGPRTRILSLACGPAREIRDFLASTALDREVVVSLLEQDVRALAFAQAELAPFAGAGSHVQVEPVHTAVKHLFRDPIRFSHLGRQNLIYAAGLFDYLPTDVARPLLRTLFGFLAPCGTLVVGNLSPRCDSQGFLESLVDWHMMYRTDEELLGLADGLPGAPTIEREATGVNSFLVLRH
jgi:extracellular factor (EF) 3-hydroxypalmitic acid methyl ester biosynthesis protein